MVEEFRANHPIKYEQIESQIVEIVREVEEVILLVKADVEEQNRIRLEQEAEAERVRLEL
jgi:ABC-type proline/glycine betaine transport system ATPase subunit